MADEQRDVRIRWIRPDDYNAVCEIEEASYEDPWTKGDFLEFMKRDDSYLYVAVDEDTEQVLGFVAAVGSESSLVVCNVAVHEDHRRKGIGSRLIGRIATKLTPGKRDRLLCHVDDGRLPAHLFLKSLGFLAQGVIDYDRDKQAYAFSYECPTC